MTAFMAAIGWIIVAFLVGFLSGLLVSWYVRKRSLVDKVDK